MSLAPDFVLAGGNVAVPGRIIRGGWVSVRAGRIEATGEGAPPAAVRTVDARGRFVLPGFVDTHMHGGLLYQMSAGRYDPARAAFDDADARIEEGFERVPRAHARHGTTSMLVTSGCQSREALLRFLRIGSRYAGRTERTGARVLGLDMEGPFVRNPAFAGALDPSNLLEPTPALLEAFAEAAGGQLRKILVAPEWGASALSTIRRARDFGIVCSVGHTGCTGDEFRSAVDAGAAVFVHFGNGPSSQDFKRGGAVDVCLEMRGRVAAELILDLHHVHPLWVNAFLVALRFQVLAITDATFLALAPDDVREAKFGPYTRILNEERTTVFLKDKPGMLSGSASTMDRMLGNLLTLFLYAPVGHVVGPIFDHPLSLDEALVRALPLFTETPARIYGQEKRLGRIEPGLLADLVLARIEDDGRRVSVGVDGVWVEGEPIPA
ncbi:MAG: amidohydrolase family protein [Planctomycetota bacterium]